MHIQEENWYFVIAFSERTYVRIGKPGSVFDTNERANFDFGTLIAQ